MEVLPKRMSKYGLTVHPEKTRLVRFQPPQSPDTETSFFDSIDVTLAGIATLTTGDTQFLKDGLARISGFAAEAMKQ